MIFKLKKDFSRIDLQKSYKKLVKKYHPDSNPENQDWSHKKMTEINLAYEQCCDFLENPQKIETKIEREEKTAAKEEPKPKDPFRNTKNSELHVSSGFALILSESGAKIAGCAERFFEYGLENRKLRHEGVRRFRYRECMRYFEIAFDDIMKIEQYCKNKSDQKAVDLFIRFTGNLFHYIQVQEDQIPYHHGMNRYWQAMEDYLIYGLMDYLSPHLMKNYKKLHWNTAFTQCWNEILYLKKRYPGIQNNPSFLLVLNLADSYKKIRLEEHKSNIRFFPL